MQDEGNGSTGQQVSEADITLSLEEKAIDEWAEVERRQNERAASPEAPLPAASATSTPAQVKYDDAVSHFMGLDLTEQKKKIVTEDNRPKGLFSSFFSLFFTANSLNKNVMQERDNVFAIALIAYDNHDVMHSRVLQTIYMILQGVNVEGARFGAHWEEIGFQGDDPATDLRGVGMLGLLQLLFFVRKYADLAKKIHKLSRDEKQCFPFSVVSLNFTKIILQTMRSGILNAKFNKRGHVLPYINELLVGLHVELYLHWRRGHRTIADFPPLLKELTDKCMKQPGKIVSTLKNFLRTTETSSPSVDGFVSI